VVFPSADFDLVPYADFDMSPYVRRTYCSWNDASWRSLLVQCFDHAPQAEQLPMPAAADLHLVLYVAGDVDMRTRAGGKPDRRRRVPGSLELLVPGQASTRDYRATSAMRTVQVHIPSATVDRAADRLGGPRPDFEALSAAMGAGDPMVESVVRALPAAAATNDLYAESAAAFLATHLLAQGRHDRLPGPEHSAVRAGIAVMKEKLAEPLPPSPPSPPKRTSACTTSSAYSGRRRAKRPIGSSPGCGSSRRNGCCPAARSPSRRSPAGADSPVPERFRRRS
jgi:AraC family transcriptional regulator